VPSPRRPASAIFADGHSRRRYRLFAGAARSPDVAAVDLPLYGRIAAGTPIEARVIRVRR